MQKKIVYPHHIPFIGKNFCDICKKVGTKTYTIPYSKYKGLVACDNSDCRNSVKTCLLKTTIPLAELIEELGEIVNVDRSNGNLETGWRLTSYAYRDEENGPFWVFVSKNEMTKCITLENLRRLNSF